jgi:TPR repeat protein
MAARQGHAIAQFTLGVMYRNGRGVSQDNTEAAKWYQKAADQGVVRALINLRFIYPSD